MNCLLYCIFSTGAVRPASLPPGINGKPVVFAQRKYLCAAVSPLVLPLSSDAESLLRYGRFINAVHGADLTILPFRYGMVLPGFDAVQKHLERFTPRYTMLLTKLNGYSEMSVRFFHPASPSPEAEGKAVEGHFTAETEGIGASYLERRRHYYTRQQMREEERLRLRAELLGDLEGLFAQWREETETAIKGERWSFYFLVPRRMEACFRRAVRRSLAPSAEVSVSGPWPPYNFVDERTFSGGEGNDSETFQ